MIVILEGPDGGGKTTLAKHLCKWYRLEYQHEGPPPPDVDPLVYYGAKLQAARGKRVLFDRFALGERVYGPILRKNDWFGFEGWNVFQRVCNAAGAVQITCLPKREICRMAWASGRTELIRDEDRWNETYDAFARLHDVRSMLQYDFTDEESLKRVHTLCCLTEETKPWLDTALIGSPLARYVFIGDRGSDPRSPTTDLAFYGTTDSSMYLTRALRIANVNEMDVAFGNIFHHTTGDYVNYRNRIPKGAKVIALGEIADRALSLCGDVKHERAPHPQYWRRFRHSELNEYADFLKRCMHADDLKHNVS